MPNLPHQARSRRALLHSRDLSHKGRASCHAMLTSPPHGWSLPSECRVELAAGKETGFGDARRRPFDQALGFGAITPEELRANHRAVGPVAHTGTLDESDCQQLKTCHPI